MNILTKKNSKFYLSWLNDWLKTIKINSPEQAKLICKIIPAQCPFARNIKLFGRTILHIPPLCKLNPFYEQLMMIRFKALSYLAHECSENTILLG